MKNTLKITHAEIYKYGGETIEQVVSRIKNQLLEIPNIHAEGNVLCVSHGGVMINLLKDIAPDYIEYRIQNKLPIVDNCDVLILESDGTSLQLIQKYKAL